MFEEMVVSSPKNKKTNKPWTVVLSMALQAAFLAVLILIPLIYTEALPKASLATLLIAPPPPPPPPPPPAAAPVVHVKPQAHLMDAGKLIAPKVIPPKVVIIKEDAAPEMGVSGGVPGGVGAGEQVLAAGQPHRRCVRRPERRLLLCPDRGVRGPVGNLSP